MSSWLKTLSNLVSDKASSSSRSSTARGKREYIEMATFREQPLIIFDDVHDQVEDDLSSPNKRAKSGLLEASKSVSTKLTSSGLESKPLLFTPPKRKPQPVTFDNFRLFMDHKYDHERSTPSPVKCRFPGKLAAKHGVVLMQEELGFCDITELGVGCYGTAYSVRIPNSGKVKGQEAAKEEVSVCKTYVFGRDYDFQKKSGIFGEWRANSFKNFSNEVALYKQICHPNIVQYRSCFQLYSGNRNDSRLLKLDHERFLDTTSTVNQNYQLLASGLVIEKVDLTLDRWISVRYQGAMPPTCFVREMFVQIGSALSYLHRDLHICHNDIKLDNVGVMDRGGQGQGFVLKLFDFSNSVQHSAQLYHQAEEHCAGPEDSSLCHNDYSDEDKENRNFDDGSFVFLGQPSSANNPFLKECWSFGLFIMNIATKYQLISFDDDDDDDQEESGQEMMNARCKFVKHFHGDDRLKEVLLRMVPRNATSYPELLVSVSWAMSKYFGK